MTDHSADPESVAPPAATPAGPERIYRHRLPVRISHWINVLALSLLLMSGLQIFNSHPRLYWGQYGADFDAPFLEIDAAMVDGKAQGRAGDTFFAVVEFSQPIHAEALLGYGNWSKPGSKHVDDQLQLFSKKQMRPVWKARADIEANLEGRKTF